MTAASITEATASSDAAVPGPAELHRRVLGWYAGNARDLPWRAASATPWAVLVSEIMLQQTPVARVRPVFDAWMAQWPTPAALAAASAGDAVRAWGRLGYPRRALRLHEAANVIVDRHDGAVPASHDQLRALPGVGEYTAAAVASFGFGQRHVVLDTNVRRVLARLVTGTAFPARTLSRSEREVASRLLPEDPETAAAWAVGVMELGALVCTATRPRCRSCPVAGLCSWRLAGSPEHDGPPRRAQAYAGTDRQCRGRLLGMLREAEGPLDRTELDTAWDVEAQRERCLLSLVHDGLVCRAGPDTFTLPR
jgi:A/G-specific adenine glycosylase